MDAQTSSPDQGIGGDQQPSELPILAEKDDSQNISDHVPLSSSQQNADTRPTLTTEPFQPILKVLADLERDDPKFAFPAARLVGLYRRLWESCVFKQINGQKLEQENLLLEKAGAHLRKKKDGLQLRHDKQLARLHFLEQALDSSIGKLVSVLNDWNHPSTLNLAGLSDNAKEK